MTTRAPTIRTYGERRYFRCRPRPAEAGAYGINKTLVKFMNKRPQRPLPADGPTADARAAEYSCR